MSDVQPGVPRSLHGLVLTSAHRGASLQDSTTGAMPAGQNGPYGDPETPVRNTSHWLITFLAAHRIGGDGVFREAAGRAADYLGSRDARPTGTAFWHRMNPEKDSCNGLIGQAWTIEALAEASAPLGRPDLAALGEEVFLLHPQEPATGVWRRVGADGTRLPIDPTFNHQLWFAAAGALLARDAGGEVEARVLRFMDRLDDLISLYPSGLIHHPLRMRLPQRSRIRFALNRWGEWKHRDHLRYKAEGYHAFNLYAFALLKGRYPDHAFWSGPSFLALWRYARSPEFRAALDGNRYAYPYNPPGWEMPFALEVFDGSDAAMQESWLAEQVRRGFDPATGLVSRGAPDPSTHAARLYEATRLPDLPIRVRPHEMDALADAAWPPPEPRNVLGRHG